MAPTQMLDSSKVGEQHETPCSHVLVEDKGAGFSHIAQCFWPGAEE